MSRIIRTVSLDRKSDEIAAKKPNFSRWVREQLVSQDESVQNSHVTLALYREKGICNPSSSPRCNICFPHGRPILSDIREYNSGRITSSELQDITKKKSLSQSLDKNLNKEKIPKDIENISIQKTGRKERKYLRRTLRYIWSFI